MRLMSCPSPGILRLVAPGSHWNSHSLAAQCRRRRTGVRKRKRPAIGCGPHSKPATSRS